jgi:chemotaxis protein histidine kinase CheA
LEPALLADGLSTKGSVSEYSGMGAMREACRALGGTLRVHSAFGRGTRIEFAFPVAANRADASLRAAS